MKATSAISAFSFLVVLTACGGSQKDLDRAKQNLRSEQDKSVEIKNENANLSRFLKSTWGTEKHTWILTDAMVSYKSAEALCQTIGHRLPVRGELESFSVELPEEWKEVQSLKQQGVSITVHVASETMGVESGVALCVKDNG